MKITITDLDGSTLTTVESKIGFVYVPSILSQNAKCFINVVGTIVYVTPSEAARVLEQIWLKIQ
jgi:hypothetical protein